MSTWINLCWACKANSNTQKAIEQVIKSHWVCVFSSYTLNLVLQSPPPKKKKTQANKPKEERNLFSIFSVSSKHSLTPPQTAGLTQDKPALAASGSQSAQWLIDPAPEPNVNKGLTLLGCLKKKERKAQLCEVLVSGAAGSPPGPWQQIFSCSTHLQSWVTRAELSEVLKLPDLTVMLDYFKVKLC